MFQGELFTALSLALERGLKNLVVLVAGNSGLHLAGCAASQSNMWMPLEQAYPNRVHLLHRKTGPLGEAFVHSKMFLIDDIYGEIRTI